MISLNQRLRSGKTQEVFLNPDYIRRIIPWNGGSIITEVSGEEIEVSETPQDVNSKIKS